MKKSIIILILIFSSCVENKLFFTISPDGSYEVNYKAYGDKDDLIDFDFPIPSNNKWSIQSNINDSNLDSFEYSAYRLFEAKESFPTSFYNDDSLFFESLLKHPVKITYKNWFFRKNYIFEGQFIGRQVENKYPLILELLNDIENPPNGWIKEALQYILLETINLSNIEWNTRPIIKSKIKNWFNTDLQTVNDSIIINNINYYKKIGINLIKETIFNSLYSELDSIFYILEKELQITLDLIDDDFSIKLILPGIVESTNADSLFGDTLFWSFQLEDYINKDYKFYANSNINYKNRQILGIIIVFSLIGIIFIINKKFNK